MPPVAAVPLPPAVSHSPAARAKPGLLPDVPDMPGAPDVPGAPGVPGVPGVPDMPIHAVSVYAAGVRSACSTASADGRSAGSFASSASISAVSGPALRGGSSGSTAIEYAVSTAVSLRNGGRPSIAW